MEPSVQRAIASCFIFREQAASISCLLRAFDLANHGILLDGPTHSPRAWPLSTRSWNEPDWPPDCLRHAVILVLAIVWQSSRCRPAQKQIGTIEVRSN